MEFAPETLPPSASGDPGGPGGPPPGGGGAEGPLCGRRVVNWNVRIHWTDRDERVRPERRARFEAAITAPQSYVRGALVGITGAPVQPDAVPWMLPPGDKETLVVDWGIAPAIVDLYAAQRRWWQSMRPEGR